MPEKLSGPDVFLGDREGSHRFLITNLTSLVYIEIFRFYVRFDNLQLSRNLSFLLGCQIYWHELFILPVILISVRSLVTSLPDIDNFVGVFLLLLLFCLDHLARGLSIY